MKNVTLLDHQLDSIASAITEYLKHDIKQSSQHDLLLNTTVKRQADHVCVDIREYNSVRNTVLKLTPLFSGSYTQSEVIVEYKDNRKLQHSQNTLSLNASYIEEKISNCYFEPSVIEPALHYARFNSLPDNLDKIYHSDYKPISIIVEENDLAALEVKHRISHKLNNLIALHPTCNDIVIVQLKINDYSVSHGTRFKGIDSVDRDDLKIPIGISVHSTVVTKPEQLFTLATRSQVALVPSLSLAMDATIAGCPIIFYATDDLTKEFSCILESIEASNNLQQSQLQHLAIRKYQIQRYSVRTLANYKSELYRIMDGHAVANTEIQATTTERQHQLSAEQFIIPLHHRRASDVKERLTHTRSKFHKLRHSPKQFLQDSSNPRLRKLGNLRSS